MELDKLIQAVRSYTDSSRVEPILTEAYQIASEAHRIHLRFSGEPFINHPLAVASILADWHAPVNVVAVGLLHDIDSLHYSQGYDPEQIQSKLGSDICRLLDAMFNLSRFIKHTEADSGTPVDINNIIEQYLFQQERDVVIIKIADQLHNLQTISFLSRDFQERTARKGITLLATLADRLGMRTIKILIENESFKTINPLYYNMFKQHYEDINFKIEIESLMNELKQNISSSFQNAEVRWEFDSLYVMYSRQLEQNYKYGNPSHTVPSSLRLIDAGSFIIRLSTDEANDCYPCLGILHKHYLPVYGQFRDVIGTPKYNGYQSLHTHVKHSSGKFLRLIIRTSTMDLIAERGVTAGWWHVPEELLPRFLPESKPVADRIQILTPGGEIKPFPLGATPIDYAYAIHSDLGNHCIGVLINGERADLRQPLKTGDRVEIIGGDEAEPHLDWLEFVQTHQALNGIRQWFTKNRRNEMIKLGHTLLDGELQQLGLTTNDNHVWQQLNRLAEKEQLKGANDLLVSIPLNKNKASKIVEQLQLLQSPKYVELDLRVNSPSPAEDSLSRVFAKCCKPKPPKDIVGLRRNDKLVIHRDNCSRIKEQKELIPVKWDTLQREPNFVVIVEAFNRQGLATEVSNAVSLLGVDMLSFSAQIRPDKVLADAYIALGKTTSVERARIKKAIDNIAYVNQVEVVHSTLIQSAAQKSPSQKPIYYSNPYSTNLATGRRFYGRRTECERITALLQNHSQNTAILLWGQKRIGKSSLLIHLREQFQEYFLPVFVDVQGLSDASTARFIHHLMERISQILKEKTIEDITVPNLNKVKKDGLGHFDTFMAKVQEITHYQPIVIILDEFQCLCTLREEIISREVIFDRLRSYSQYGQGIHMILSGGGLRSQLLDLSGVSSLFNISYDQKLGKLEKKAAKQLIIDGLTKVATITEDSIDLVLSITSCHPFYLQLLCRWLFEHAQEEKVTFTHETTTCLIQEWVNKADASRFQHLWEATDIAGTQRNKIILSAIAQLEETTKEVEYSNLEALVDSRIKDQILVRALTDLSDLGILRHNRMSYAIEVELLASWLRQHYPFELALKETP